MLGSKNRVRATYFSICLAKKHRKNNKCTRLFTYCVQKHKSIAKIFGIRLNLDELEEKMFDEGFLVVCLEAEEKVDVFFELEYCLDELLNSLVKITRQNRKGFLCVKISRFPRTVSGKINYNYLRKEQNGFRL